MIWSCTHSGPKSEPQTLLSPYCFASQAAPLILYAYRTYAAYVLYLQMLQITNQTVWDKPHVNDSANQPICMANFAIPPWSYNSFLRHECGPIHHAAICTYTLGISQWSSAAHNRILELGYMTSPSSPWIGISTCYKVVLPTIDIPS